MISLPKNTELHLGQAITYAQVHTKLKYHMGAGIKAINDQFSGSSNIDSSRLPDKYHITTGYKTH